MKLSVIMPVYNEVATIKEIVRRVMRVRIPKELIIVDDGSTDGTREKLKEIASLPAEELGAGPQERIRIFFHRRNKGKGAAIRTGLKHCTGDIIIIQDADLEYYPEEYHRVIQPIMDGRADVVYGSRFLGTHRVYMFTHYLANLVLNFLANLLYNTILTDMETCYKAFRADVIKGIKLRSDGFGFEAEVTARIFQRQLRVYETPISYSGRTYEEGKKITWRDGVRTLYWLLACKLSRFDEENQSTLAESILRKYPRFLLSKISPFIGNRVLEIGSGSGNMTTLLIGRRLIVASDKSPERVSFLRNRFVEGENLRILQYDLTEPPPAELKEGFDTVLCMNVLEHVEDDSRAVASLRELVSPGGKVVIVVPAYRALFSGMDRALGHFRRYDMRRITQLLAENGLAPKEMRYLNMLAAVGWLLNGKIMRRKTLPRFQMWLFDKMTTLLKLEDFVKAPFGLSILAVAEKT